MFMNLGELNLPQDLKEVLYSDNIPVTLAEKIRGQNITERQRGNEVEIVVDFEGNHTLSKFCKFGTRLIEQNVIEYEIHNLGKTAAQALHLAVEKEIEDLQDNNRFRGKVAIVEDNNFSGEFKAEGETQLINEIVEIYRDYIENKSNKFEMTEEQLQAFNRGIGLI